MNGDNSEMEIKNSSLNIVSASNETHFSYQEMNAQIIEHIQKYDIDTSELTNTDTILYDPLEVILKEVVSKKLNPQDINIVELADFYISILFQLKKFDIRESGRVIYRASKLLKLKAEKLKYEEQNEEYDFFDNILNDEEFMGDVKVPEIANHYKADEICLNLCRTAARSKYKKLLPTLPAPVPRMEFYERPSKITTEHIMELAHEEDILSLKVKLSDVLDEMFTQNGSVPFTLLTDTIAEAKSMIYITLLHLATDRKIWLLQDDLYDTELLIFPQISAQ